MRKLKHSLIYKATMLYAVESKLSAMNSTYGQRLAEALRLARRERQELADAISVSVQAIGQVIIGSTKAFNAENNERAARYLGVNPYWLATGEEGPSLDTPLWPFAAVSVEQWSALTAVQRGRIEGFAEAIVREASSDKSNNAPHAA